MKILKGFIGIIFILVSLTKVNAQQDLQVNHFMYNDIYINPGSAGHKDMVSASIIQRTQWQNFPGAPKDLILNVDLPFSLLKQSHGVGISLVSDTWGFNNNIEIKVAYAYRINFRNGKLGIGINAEILNNSFDATQLKEPENSDYHTFDDIYKPQGDQDVFAYDIGFGLFYKTDDLFVGASSTHLTEAVFKYTNEDTGVEPTYKMKRHYYLTAGYNIQLSNPVYEITPSVFIQSDGVVTKYDINTMLTYNKKIWGGVTIRPVNAVAAMIGFDIFNGVKIGAAYEFPTSKIASVSTQTYEFFVNYSFTIGGEKTPQKYKSIRFL